MATINLNNRTGGGTSMEDRPILPTDMYRMKCIEATIKDDTFAKPNKDGSVPQKISTVWEMSALTEEQQDAAAEIGQDWNAVRIWRDFNPYYGTVKAGGSSKFKEFIDSLRGQGHLPDFDLEAFDVEALVGIEQRCSVECYTKSMGENAGKPGNRITTFASIRKPKTTGPRNTPTPFAPEELAADALPF